MFTKANVESREKGNAGFHDWHLLMLVLYFTNIGKKVKNANKNRAFPFFLIFRVVPCFSCHGDNNNKIFLKRAA